MKLSARCAIASGLLATLVTMSATAQPGTNSVRYIQQGKLELGFNANLSFPDEGDDNLFAFGQAGWFVTDALLLRGTVSYLTSGGIDVISAGPGVDYHFANPTSDVMPYIGASYLLNLGDFDETDFYEAHVGVKKFLSERTAVQLELQRREAVDSDFDGFASTDLIAGFNVYF